MSTKFTNILAISPMNAQILMLLLVVNQFKCNINERYILNYFLKILKIMKWFYQRCYGLRATSQLLFLLGMYLYSQEKL